MCFFKAIIIVFDFVKKKICIEFYYQIQKVEDLQQFFISVHQTPFLL